MDKEHARKILETNYRLPYKPHEYQYESMVGAFNNKGAMSAGVLFRDKVGLGKSITAFGYALLLAEERGVEQVLAVMPPVLIDQFVEFVNSIGGIDPPVIYAGTPAQRAKLQIESAPVVIMSYHIFRNDYARVLKWSGKTKLCVLCDELSMKSANTTLKKLKELIYGKLRVRPGIDIARHEFCGLNATPISDRGQVYYWCSVFRPEIYWSKKMFDIRHAGTVDPWGNVKTWHDTDFMDESFDSFSVISKGVELEIPKERYKETQYALGKKHMELYRDISEAEFKKLPENLIEMAVDSLFSTLQRVVLNPAEFGLDIRPPILDLLDTYFDQMDDEDRVVVYTRHVSVSKMLRDAYPKAVTVFGGVKDRAGNIRRFKEGDAQVMIANHDSLGKGANLQVANHMVFVELPFRSDMFTQCVGRIVRQGQTRPCLIDIPTAAGTIQRRIYRNLLNNDEDLLNFNRNKKKLREFICNP